MQPATEPEADTSAALPPPTSSVRTARVVVVAVLAELAVILAVGNQWVTQRLFDSIERDLSGGSAFARDFKTALITYNWRFSPRSSDHQHILLSQLLLIFTTLAVTAALIAVVVRGPAGFARVFFACWMSVVVATMFGAYLRGFASDVFSASGSRITRAMFGALGPNSFTFLAGVLLGLLVALVAATVAVATRDVPLPPTPAPDEPGRGAAFFEPEQPPPYYGE